MDLPFQQITKFSAINSAGLPRDASHTYLSLFGDIAPSRQIRATKVIVRFAPVVSVTPGLGDTYVQLVWLDPTTGESAAITESRPLSLVNQVVLQAQFPTGKWGWRLASSTSVLLTIRYVSNTIITYQINAFAIVAPDSL